ncbi:DUF2141 domain-containing protein [Sphingosinicella sp. BN140058]|uniref:DUF2141 domain-containing protein n=1 Tax=Sphingosinicella sp. BN140058 TaxID=1892855 RepID=UPI001010B0F6|nr:DUF2141 domain-containing protein [Sphingosinicella sp. BN140058]QAY76695.1 DUF2141 domain-containing protein [Sphingosinicella sp. BN140058]
MLSGAAAPSEAELDIALTLRNANGLVRLCLTGRPANFPADCKADPNAVRKTVAAARTLTVRIPGVAPGTYGLSLIHDENGNGKLDKIGPVPTEGFGFSRNPGIRFGPPAFKDVSFSVGGGKTVQTVRVRYLL